MRDKRSLTILGIATLVVVLTAILVRQQTASTSQQDEKLFPELLTQINETAEITGTSNEGKFTLLGRDGRWLVKEKHGYPADADKVHQLLVGLSELRRIEPKTSDPELYSKIGVEDVTVEGAKSLRVTLKSADGRVLADVLVGNRQFGKANPNLHEYFVRAVGEPQSWLVEGKIPDDKSLTSWLDSEIVEIDSARVSEVRVSHPDGHTVVVRRTDPGSNDYELVGLPKGAELESQWAVNSIANTLTDLTLDDVQPASDVKFKKPADLTVELDTFDGLRVKMETMKQDDKNFTRFSATFEPSLVRDVAKAKTETAESEDKNTGEKAKMKDPDTVNKEVEQLTARWNDWVYVVPRYRIDSLAKKKSDLIKSEKTQETG